MPSESIRWKCDLCGEEYDTIGDATECECGHSHVKKVIYEDYNGKGGHWGFLDAPAQIHVEMSDGAKIVYVRHDRLEEE